MLKFSVQTFYQPLISNSPLAIIFPSAISLQHFPFSNSFPFNDPFPFQSLPHQKAKSQKPKSQKQKPQAKSPKQKAQSKSPKQKALHPPSASLLYPVVNRVEQWFLERGDTVTGETCVPASLNINNLGEAAVLHFPFLWPGAVPISAYR
jgi:hypothetical protein